MDVIEMEGEEGILQFASKGARWNSGFIFNVGPGFGEGTGENTSFDR